MRRPILFLAALILIVLGGSGFSTVYAQGITPTADQLDMFRNLPADQQQSLMRQLGGGLGSSGSLGSLGSGASRLGQDQSPRDGESNYDRQRTAADGEESNDQDNAIPVLQPEDTLVVEIDFQLGPRPLSSYAIQYPTLGAQNSALPPSAQNLQNGQAAASAAAAANAQQTQQQPAAAPAVTDLSDGERARLGDQKTPTSSPRKACSTCRGSQASRWQD
jgi:hypothetical protein